MQEFKIGPNEAGQRLDKFLHKYLKYKVLEVKD